MRMLLGSCRWWNPVVGLTWKTVPLRAERRVESSPLSGCAATLRVRDIASNRLLYRLAPWERRTGATGCGLLPTPVAMDNTTPQKNLREAVGRRTFPPENRLKNLPGLVTDGLLPKRWEHYGLTASRDGADFRLSAWFVEEMMGYPLMWTAYPFLTRNGGTTR